MLLEDFKLGLVDAFVYGLKTRQYVKRMFHITSVDFYIIRSIS